MILAYVAAQELVPTFAAPEDRELAALVASDAGRAFLDGAWGWYALVLALMVFTILGEELLFRGFLLPRMNGAFGRGDWVANGLLFTAYHLHVPWAMPATLLDTFTVAYPTKRYRSAWIGIAVHSAQSIFFARSSSSHSSSEKHCSLSTSPSPVGHAGPQDLALRAEAPLGALPKAGL